MTEPNTTEETIIGDQAPPPIAIIAAYAGVILAFVLIIMIFTTAYAGGHVGSLAIISLPLLMMSHAPSFLAAMLTRRSPLVVTASAAALAMLLQPNAIGIPGLRLLGAGIIGAAVWLVGNRHLFGSKDLRRPLGQGMPRRLWMPATGVALGILPFIFRREPGAYMLSMQLPFLLLLFPIAWLLLTGWLAAIVADRVGVHMERRRIVRPQSEVRED